MSSSNSESNVVLIKNNPWDAAIRECLERATLQRVKKAQLNIDDFNFTLAPDYGSNPGYIYIKHKGQYLGKIKGNNLQVNIDVDDIDTTIALAHCFNLSNSELQTEAIAYGRRTGICSCCGLTLTNPLSISLGIGPICREKYGWSTSLVDVDL